MNNESIQQWLSKTAWQGKVVKGLIGLAVIWAFFLSFTVVDASSFVSTGDTSSRAAQAFTDDTDVIVTSTGIRKISSTIAAVGDSAPGVEATGALPQVNNALIKDHYAYGFHVKEATPDSWRIGDNLKIEVYGDNGSSTVLLATLSVQQSKAEHTTVEGVSATIDVGSSNSIPDRFDIIVTRR